VDEAAYKVWWPFHLRVAGGEVLSEQDQSFYEAGLCELHRSETIHLDGSAVKLLDDRIAEAERVNAELARRRQFLESRLSQPRLKSSSKKAGRAGQGK
jgi:hypothetical protein